MENTHVSCAFLKITLHRMVDLYYAKLKEVLETLPSDSLWTEAYKESNTIGGIVMHVCEHVARNCLRLTEREDELGTGFEEFFPNSKLTSGELLAVFESQLREWSLIMNRYIQHELSLEEEHLHQLYHLVEHTGYHLGQIIDRAQGVLGTKFDFYGKGLNESYLRSKIIGDIDAKH